MGAVKPCKKGFKGSMGVKSSPPQNTLSINVVFMPKKGLNVPKKIKFLQKKSNFGWILVDFWPIKLCYKVQKGQDESERYVPKCLAPKMRQNDHIFGSQGHQKPKGKIGEMSKSAVRQVALNR